MLYVICLFVEHILLTGQTLRCMDNLYDNVILSLESSSGVNVVDSAMMQSKTC